MADIKGKQLSDNLAVTNVTASGTISGSDTGSFAALSVSGIGAVAGDLNVGQYIKHTGDANTRINFTDDRIQIEPGNLAFIGAHKKSSAPHQVTINNGGNNIDFVVKDNDGDILFKTDADEDNVIFPEAKKISGSAISTGSFGELEIGNGGDIVLTEDQRVYFEADKGTWIESHASDSFRVVVNDKQMFLLDEDTGDRAVFGNGTKVFIGANNNFTPSASLHIAGNLWVSGSDAQGGAHITASGNISASGDITGNILNVNTRVKAIGSSLEFAGNTLDFVDGSSAGRLFKGTAGGSFEAYYNGQKKIETTAGGILVGSGSISGNITASGDISSSASGSFTNVEIANNTTIDGDLIVSQYIKHKGDVNTAINFTDNKIKLEAGGMSFASFYDDDSAPFTAKINNDSNRINFLVYDKANQLLLKTDSDEGWVNLYYSGSEKLSTQTGGVNITGNVSASGNMVLSGSQIKFQNDAATGETYTFNNISSTLSSDHSLGFNIASGSSALDSILKVSGSHVGGFVGINKYATDVLTKALMVEGAVSASGDLEIDGAANIATTLTVGGNLDVADTIYHTGDSNTKIRFPAVDTIAFHTNGSERMSIGPSGHITSSVNISGSGGSILGFDTGSFAYMTVGSSIIRDGDPDTKLTFTDDDLNITIGGVNMVDFTQDTVSEVTFNEAGADVDFRIETTNDSKALYINAGDDTIQLGSSANTHVTASGNISGSGGNILGFKDITATGNITAQGDVIAENYIVSSSVTYMTSSVMSGSTRWGDTPADDTHLITGSMFISGSGTDLTNTMTASFASVKLQHAGHLSGSLGTLTGIKQANITSGSFDYINVTGNVTASSLETSGDIVAFGSSDRNLKDNIQPIENPLEKMDKIGGYTFVWNDNQNVYKGKDVGVVAQEIQEVLPEIVATRANGYLGVKYEKIVPLLIESIKENTKKIEELEQEINKINKNCDCLNK